MRHAVKQHEHKSEHFEISEAHTITLTLKAKKILAATNGHAHLVSRHIVPVRCNLLEPGQGAHRSTDCTSHCRCGHPVVPPVPLAVRKAQPVHFAPQYKTRYPLVSYRSWYYFNGQKFPPYPGIWTGVYWIMSSKTPLSHTHSHTWPSGHTCTHTLTLTHTLTHAHTHTHTLTHTHTHTHTHVPV